MKNSRHARSRSIGGFLLFEVMLGVAIFSMGVIALGVAVNNCLDAQAAMADSDRARLALENRMAQVFGGAIAPDTNETEELEGAFEGITMIQKSEPLKAKDEDGKDIVGLTVVTLSAEWVVGTEKQSNDISFYISASL